MAATAEAIAATPKKKVGRGALIALVVVGVLAAGGGFAAPRLLTSPGENPHPSTQAHKVEKTPPAVIAFGDTVVNLRDGRGGRFIRVKILLVVASADEKHIGEHMHKQKPFLKTWLISYLADQSVEDVLRTTGINRIRREIRDQFNALLFPDGSEKIMDILFDDFLVQ
jgi:flagellar protein FliL